MRKIIHVTDCHLGPPGEPIVGFDPADRLRTVIRSINENHADAELCVLTGDLADHGDYAEYAALRECLADLRVRYRLMLGNHDRRRAFCAAFADEPIDQDGFLQSTLDLDDWSLIFLDTLDEGHPGRGLLCDKRLAWFDAELTARRNRPILIFMHHPPASIGVPAFEDMLLVNGAECLARIAAHPSAAHIAFGHVHMKVSGCFGRVPYSSSRGTCHKIAPAFGGNRVDYVDAGPAYDTLLLGQRGAVIHAMDPAGPNALVAHEYPTEDGRGRIEMMADRSTIRWE